MGVSNDGIPDGISGAMAPQHRKVASDEPHNDAHSNEALISGRAGTSG
jgi:hypothetical protein